MPRDSVSDPQGPRTIPLLQEQRMATILIIDPEASRLRLHSDVIRSMGHAPVTAASGAAGIQALSDHPETTLVACHLNLPDGRFEDFLAAVRRAPHYAIVPFVMMAEDIDSTRLLQLVSSGVEGTLKLPVDPEFLAHTVRKGIEVYAQRHLLERRVA